MTTVWIRPHDKRLPESYRLVPEDMSASDVVDAWAIEIAWTGYRTGCDWRVL